MSDLSKCVNLLIEFEQKIEVNVNKKYKTFIRSILNLEVLAKSIKADRVILTRELIVFKLGLEAKSPKAIEISLTYLLKLFQMKFIDLNHPNLCENYVIEQAGVKEVSAAEIKTEVRHQIIDLIKMNIHYKNNNINQLILKVLEFLIAEPILTILLEIAVQYPQELTNTVLFNYFSFRFYVFEEICYYNENEIKSFPTVTLRTERLDKQIKNALEENNILTDLISKYMNEYLSIIESQGGRYGSCVMCQQPADHYCRITRASLCGMECKKKHLQVAEKQYKHYLQFVTLWEAIYNSFQELLIFLSTHESPIAFSVLTNLLEKPHLFMLTKNKFRQLLGKHVPNILSKIILYRNESSFEHIYYFMVHLAKYWLFECLSSVQYFFKEYILKVLQDKKPSYKFLNMVFKALARVMEHGKTTIQLYINFDCEVNKENIIQKSLFEVSKITQDRFIHAAHLTSTQKKQIKNHCLSLFIILSMGLNQYRKYEQRAIEVAEIVTLKQKKMNLEQFVVRFNEHWTSGLKTLFNLNLVGLDSNQQIVDILTNLKGLSKDNIDQLFFCEKGTDLFQIFISKLVVRNKKDILMGLLDLLHFIPLKVTSIGVKKYIDALVQVQKEFKEKQIMHWLQFLTKNYTYEDFKKELSKGKLYPVNQIEQLHMYALETKQAFTVGNTKIYFTYCCSKSYLQVIASQISLLQIPISYLLQTGLITDTDRILILIEQLLQICSHSNWISLLIKYSAIKEFPSASFDEIKLKIVIGTILLIEKQAVFVQDWSTIIHFLSSLYNIIRRIELKQIVEGNLVLSEQIPIYKIQHCLLSSSSKSQTYFNKLMLAVLVVGREQLKNESLFMLQKFFEMLDLNLKKFVRIVDDFMPYLISFTQHLEHTSSEICISITDMLKQSFAKLLKLPRATETWTQHSEAEFLKLFQNMLNHKNKEVGDFVVNCISMTILHHYDLSHKSWIVVFAFMKKRVKEYRQQIYTIIEKIVNEKIRNCEQFYSDLVQLILDLIHPEETKLSTEVLNTLKFSLEIICDLKMSSARFETSSEELQKKYIKTLLQHVIDALVQNLFYQCHEYIIEILFRLLNFKIKTEPVFSLDDLSVIMLKVFNKIEGFTPLTLPISEKTISFALNWSVANKYSNIVQWFQSLIVGKYNVLSFSAVRCIKTYIQMVNPKSNQQWQHIQNSLLRVLQDTHISTLINLQIKNKFLQYQQQIQLQDSEVRMDVNLFANKMMVQKTIIEILPNHLRCLQQLNVLHEQVVSLNDNLYIRCLLWRKGLGNQTDSPPNLLSLEEIISSKLVATLNVANQNQLFCFSMKIFKRYCSASALLLKIIEDEKGLSPQSKQAENYILFIQYVKLRKVPLLRVANYFLPKLKKICKNDEQRKQGSLQLVQCCKYVENREMFLKSMKQLTKI